MKTIDSDLFFFHCLPLFSTKDQAICHLTQLNCIRWLNPLRLIISFSKGSFNSKRHCTIHLVKQHNTLTLKKTKTHSGLDAPTPTDPFKIQTKSKCTFIHAKLYLNVHQNIRDTLIKQQNSNTLIM